MVTEKKCQIREQYVELKFCCAFLDNARTDRINKTVQFVEREDLSLLEFTYFFQL